MDSSIFASWSIDATPNAPATLELMAKFCRQAMKSAAIVRYANEIIEANRPRDLVGQIETIRLFLESWFRFVNNPIGVQRIRTPLDMIRDIETRGLVMGACDDAAVLAATLGMANGIEARFRAVAFSHQNVPDASAPFTHVIADLHDGAAWRPLDVTKPLDLLRPPNVVRTLTLIV
jgi:transglutaminase-like putative cysteine protease